MTPVAGLNAADPAGTSQTVISFAGGSVWNADFSGGTCVWYFPVVGNLDFESLFSDPKNASKETSYLVWVSEFTVQMMTAAPPFLPAPASPNQAPPYALAFAPSGTGRSTCSRIPPGVSGQKLRRPIRLHRQV